MDKIVEKAKKIYAEKRKEVTAVGIALIVIVIGVMGYNWYQSQPKSLLDELKVEFSGYEGSGKLTYNSSDLEVFIRRLSYQKAGFSKAQAEAIATTNNVATLEVLHDANAYAKINRAQAYINSVSFEFDRTSGLTNGDTVIFSVKTTSKEAPVKAETKEFEVDNLKEYEKVSTSDILKEYPVTFSGVNGYGVAMIGRNSQGYSVLQFANNIEPKSLKNGDKVTLTVSSSYLIDLQEKGKTTEDTKIEVTVEGLKDLSSISNLSEALKKNEDLAKSKNENTDYRTYNLEALGNYIRITASTGSSQASSQISLITLYKVTETGTSSSATPVTSYHYYGYQSYLLNNGSLDLDTAKQLSNSYGFFSAGSKDLEGLKAKLSTDGFKEYQE